MKKETPIAVTSRSFSNHPILRKELLERYSNVTFNESGKTLSNDELINFLKGHEKAIVALELLDDRVFSSLPELKVVSKYGVGLDNIDIDSMERHGVLLGWTGGVNRRSVAELVLSCIIALLHKIPYVCNEVKKGKWYQAKGRQLTGKTVGIIGCGNIGKDLAMLLLPFECRILAYDIRNFPEFYKKYGVIPVSLEYLLTESDVVTLHIPFNNSTKNILNAEKLNLMKEGAYLINAARGGLVDEKILKEMLKKGRLSGAAFDVFSNEPPEDYELLNLPNVIVTPHIGGSTEEAILAMGRAAIAGLDINTLPSKIEDIHLLR